MPRKPKEKRSELVGVMVTPAIKEYMETVAAKDERSISTVAWLFLVRGIAAHLGGAPLQLEEPLVLPNATEVKPPNSNGGEAEENIA